MDAKWGRASPAISSMQKSYEAMKAKYERQRQRNEELNQLVNTYAAVIEELRQQRDELARANTVAPLRR